MADLLGATSPVPGYDLSSAARQIIPPCRLGPRTPRVQNVLGTYPGSARADGRTDQQGAGSHLDDRQAADMIQSAEPFCSSCGTPAPDLAAVLAKTMVGCVDWYRLGLSEGICPGDKRCCRCCGWIGRDFSDF